MTEILRAHRWGTNAKMIAEAVVPLGHIKGLVLDATLGQKEGFWKEHRPDFLHTNDLNAENATWHYDFRCFPNEWSDSYDTVVFDPAYKLSGTPAMKDMDNRFGTAEEHAKLNRAGKMAMIRDGAIECYRVTSPRGRLLVKCMDQVEGGKMRWQTDMVTAALVRLGARKVDRFDLLHTPMKQPQRKCPVCGGKGTDDEGATCQHPPCVSGRVEPNQEHAAANYSTLLVFAKS